MRSRLRGCPGRPLRSRRPQRATGGGAVRPPRARPGPPGLTPAPLPWSSHGPAPAGAPGRPAFPSRRPRRAPRAPASAPHPRARPSPAPARAPRSPGAASDLPPASAAPNLRNNKQPEMSESAAAGPPSLPGEPQARPDPGGEGRGGEGRGRRHDNLFRARAPHTHTRGTHTHTHTHTHPATAPSGGPGPRAHTQTRPRRAPHSQHSRTRSQHARTHSHPFQTRSYTRIPGTLGIHSDPRSPPAAHTTNPRHSHTYTLRTRRTDTHVPDPFPRFHTRTRISQAHTPHTRSLLHTRAESTEHSSPHAEHKHTSHSRTHNKQHSGLGHTKCPQMQHISRHNSCHTTKLKCTNNRHTILLGPTHTTQWQRHKSAHPMPRCTQHSPQHTRGHTTHTAPLLAHNSGHTPFAGTQPEHTIAHPTLRHTGSRLATSGHPTLPLSFELRHGRRGLRGASWVRPTRAYLPESRSRARRAGR